MYQAIVFLPLLGAILAGLIALAGARARWPGESPPPGAEEVRASRPAHAAPRCMAMAFMHVHAPRCARCA